MKPFVLMAACLVATAAVAAPTSEEQVLIDLENTISAAYLRGDAKTIEAHVDPTWTLTNSHAAVSGRADDLREVRAGDPKYSDFRTHDMTARIYGDTGIVLGIVSLKGTSQGKAFDSDVRFTDTFIRVNGAWKMVAAQVTTIPK